MNPENNHELARGEHPHIETKHDSEKAMFCLVLDGECGVTVEIDASPEEQEVLEPALLKAVEQMDIFFDGKFAELFRGLEIKVGDGLTEGGGEAFAEKNLVVLDRSKMLLSIREADEIIAQIGMSKVGDRLASVPDDLSEMSVAVYEVVHEIGHIVEGRADSHLPKEQRYKRAEGLTDKSPSHLYLQDPNKPHEAFAEAFAHMVYERDVDEGLRAVVVEAIDEI